MLSRRDFLTGAAGIAGAAALARPGFAAAGTAPMPRTPITFAVPAGACDTHVHVFGDHQKFPFAASRPYSPDEATVADLRALQRALHLDRVIITQPTVYGTDHACTLDAIQQFGLDHARGTAEIDEHTTDADLDALHRGGIRGVVLHNLDNIPVVAKRLRNRDWHLEFYVRVSEIDKIKANVLASPVPVVFTMFGGSQAAPGIHQPGFDSLLGLLQTGKVYVELSAPYRVSKIEPDYPDVAPIAKALIAANPDRIMWGSDWPHAAAIPGKQMTGPTPLAQIDDGLSLTLLHSWTSNADELKRILVDNPARLYGF
ncbi:MAG: amidohydrolase family protein [Acidobacteriota bacterium]